MITLDNDDDHDADTKEVANDDNEEDAKGEVKKVPELNGTPGDFVAEASIGMKSHSAYVSYTYPNILIHL